jgi:tripartite-type tricarboxylate transporter receptor subunit TctC
MNQTRRQVIQASAASIFLTSLGERVFAQSLESLKIVTGFTPGGTSDTICRRVADKLRVSYAKNAQVENKSGAGGQIAIQSMKGAPTDGSVMLQTPMSMLGIYPHIYKKLPYDPLTDVLPVSLGAVFDFGLAVGPSVPSSVQTVPAFLAWCKANPVQANFGSPAAGSVPHFIGTLLGRSAGVDLKHVPYRGTQPAILDMIGGQLPAVSGPVGEFTQHVAAGKCRLIGTSGAKRNKFAPTIATFTEQGIKDMAFNEWFGFYLPAGASPATVERLNAALRSALAAPDVIEGLAVMGLESASSSPAELAAMLKADTERWGPLVKAIGFSADA